MPPILPALAPQSCDTNIGALQEGLDVRYDQVALHVGDSLSRAISQEIVEGTSLIAIASPSSVESEWCRTELALAKTQGINERRVKVLPVKYRGAEMPPMLGDTFWGDADRYDVATVARQFSRGEVMSIPAPWLVA